MSFYYNICVKSAAKIDLKWDQLKLDAFLQQKTKHGFLEYASILAHVLMEIPLGKPIFGSEYSVSNDKMDEIRKTFRKAKKAGIQIDQDLWQDIIKEKPRGRPKDKKSVIIYFWARLAKRDGKISWAMLVRLLRWFYKRFMSMEFEYGPEICVTDDKVKKGKELKAANLGKEFKKLCTFKKETLKEYLDGSRKTDWEDKNIKTIVAYLRTRVFSQTRTNSPHSVNFSKDSIEVEADYQNGGELRTLRMNKDFKTQEYTKLLLDPSDARVFGTVTFS